MHPRSLAPRTALAAALALPLLAGCTREDLAQTNITGVNNQPIAVADLGSGSFTLDTAKLQGIRDAMASFAPGATIIVNEALQTHFNCTPGLNTACMTVDFNPTTETEPHFISAPAELTPTLLDLAGIDLTPAIGADNLELLSALRAPPTFNDFSTPFEIQITHDASQIRVSREQVIGGGLEVGVWFPITLSFPQDQFTKDFYCNCGDAGGTIPGFYSFPDIDGARCGEICAQMPDSAGLCDELRFRTRFNRVRLLLGFIPEMPAPDAASDDWTEGFGEGKGFQLATKFGLRVVIGGQPSTLALGDFSQQSLDAVGNDTAHDFGLVVDIEDGCPTEIAGISETTISQDMAAGIANMIYDTLGQALGGQLQPLFNASAPLPDAPCSLSLFATPLCTPEELQAGLAAASTYQVWDWFYGAFGPYPNGTSVKVEDVTRDAADLGLPGPSAGEPGTITFSFDGDVDDDGIFNPTDNCPTYYNPDQLDTDGDGMGDACDKCKCDGANDPDKDGVCNVGCPGQADDNCDLEPNPQQQNCNILSEDAHGEERLGDHCDPVPCPDGRPMESVEAAGGPVPHSPKLWGQCYRYTRGSIALRGLRSHSVSQPSVSVQVSGVPTSARFCQQNPSIGITCDDALLDIQDERLDDALCAPVAGGGVPPCQAPDIEDAFTRFHRMTFSLYGNGADPNGPSPSLDYSMSAGGSSIGTVWIWDYHADHERWVDSGLITNAPTVEDLRGTLWLHADTAVGDTDLSLGTGEHGAELANHHELDYSPEETKCSIKTSIRAIVQPFFLWRTLPDPPHDAYRRWDAVMGESSYVVAAEDGEWAALDGDLEAELVTSRLGAGLARRVQDTSLIWASSVEASLHQGQAAAPLAVAISNDGAALVDAVTTDGHSLLADEDRRVSRAWSQAPARALGFAAVLSRVRQGLFRVGGDDIATGRPTGEIWFTGVDAAGAPSAWSRIPTGSYRVGRVLAATYSFATDRLYVLDEIQHPAFRAPAARLASVDPDTGDVAQLGLWGRSGLFDQQWLLVDRDGALLLASSSAVLAQHALIRLDVRQPALAVDGIELGAQPLLLPPAVDGAGYSLVPQPAVRLDPIGLDRRESLTLAPLSLEAVGDHL